LVDYIYIIFLRKKKVNGLKVREAQRFQNRTQAKKKY